MTKMIPMHTPAPEFRDALERSLVRAFRAGDDDPPSLRTRRTQRWRTTVTLGLGLLLGVGTQFASAQVQQSRQQSELERAKAAEGELVKVRWQLAKARQEEARKAFDAGVTSASMLAEQEARLRAARIAIARIELDLEEIRATSESPRDELWAPPVGSRDFVKERLTLAAAVAQEELANAEKAATEVERAVGAGSDAAVRLEEARSVRAGAKLAFDLLAVQLMVREQFLKEKLSPEETTRRRERLQGAVEIEATRSRLESLQQRLARARARHEAGAGLQIEVKRAELAVLEAQAEVEQLRARLKLYERARTP
jgi:hypothetical protein